MSNKKIINFIKLNLSNAIKSKRHRLKNHLISKFIYKPYYKSLKLKNRSIYDIMIYNFHNTI